jgi:hypothetical protein
VLLIPRFKADSSIPALWTKPRKHLNLKRMFLLCAVSNDSFLLVIQNSLALSSLTLRLPSLDWVFPSSSAFSSADILSHFSTPNTACTPRSPSSHLSSSMTRASSVVLSRVIVYQLLHSLGLFLPYRALSLTLVVQNPSNVTRTSTREKLTSSSMLCKSSSLLA